MERIVGYFRELAVKGEEIREELLGAVLEAAGRAGLDEREAMSLATAAMELATNMLKHAGEGSIRVSSVEGERGKGVELTALDRGPGIGDIEAAMTEGYSTTGSMGAGFSIIRRQVDELYVQSAEGFGTQVVIRKWARSGGGDVGGA